MERLTERFSNGQAASYWCGSNCKYDHKYCRENLENCPAMEDILEKLAHYEDLEESGRLVVLPCKVGGIVWVSKNKEKTRMVLLDSIADILWYMEHGYGIGYTREEAEAALKGE